MLCDKKLLQAMVETSQLSASQKALERVEVTSVWQDDPCLCSSNSWMDDESPWIGNIPPTLYPVVAITI